MCLELCETNWWMIFVSNIFANDSIKYNLYEKFIGLSLSSLNFQVENWTGCSGQQGWTWAVYTIIQFPRIYKTLFTNTNTIQQTKSAIPIQSQYQYNTSWFERFGLMFPVFMTAS